MVKSITLPNGKTWTTQKEALEHFKSLLGRYEDGETVNDLEDHDDLVALLERYDQLELGGPEKIGAGVDHFERRRNRGEGYSSSGFWAIRTNGTETDFSCPKAVRGVPTPILAQYYDACRSAIGADLATLKQRQFDHFANTDGLIPCDVSGTLVGFSGAQLRHAKPYFGEIASEFRELNCWTLQDLEGLLTISADAQISTSFREKEWTQAFRKFHHSKAVLHIVSRNPEHGAFRAKDHTVGNPLRLD
ncbi:MAG: DCL family protein [Sulfitobacter sp.]|uniref:DCL family protein n=1 Tax=Roseibium sp. TaxID=1936156 RepID=UPI003263ECC0|tara:strand:- start:582 stop:1322 length:741 start_codon:yes stop_codon:yes gene_type:complete